MHTRHFGAIAFALIGVAGFVLAQTQTSSTSSSNSRQGSAQASSSSSAQASGGQSGQGSSRSNGGGVGISMARPTHAILYSAGEKWLPNKPAREQPLQDHAQYMSLLVKKGILLLGGPWRDEPGGMAIIRARDDEEAQMILESDPAIKNGVMAGELKAWSVMFQGPGIPMPNVPTLGSGPRPPTPR